MENDFILKEYKKIESIEFSLLSNDDIDRLSICEIKNQVLYSEPGIPTDDGPLSPKLGIPMLNFEAVQCITCHKNRDECSGHFGHVNLILPVYNNNYIKYMIYILNIICYECFEPLVQIKKNITTISKLRIYADKAKLVKKCEWCGHKNRKVKRVGNKIVQYCENKTDQLKPPEVLKIFEVLPPIFVAKLSFHPKNLIITKLLVLPSNLRPSSKLFNNDSSKTNEDDLTVKLSEIIYINTQILNSLKKNIALKLLMHDYDMLQFHVNMYINSNIADNNNIKAIKGIIQRLKGKRGRFRNNLSGKRVDFTARTVITPDPYLTVNEVGIPQRVAMNLTYKEQVTEYNIKQLRNAVMNGTDIYPGANFLIQKYMKDGKEISMKRFLKIHSKKAAKSLKLGDFVERHLINGDIVLFNRQPSLHRLSIMCHRVFVHPFKTFRFNESICAPYNADFDGDEMNLHLIRKENAKAEADILLSVSNNLHNPKDGSLSIGPTQDFLSYLYKLTYKIVFFQLNKIKLGFFSEKLNLKSPILRPVKILTGHSLFTHLIEISRNKLKINRNLLTPMIKKIIEIGDIKQYYKKQEINISYTKNQIEENKSTKFNFSYADDNTEIFKNYFIRGVLNKSNIKKIIYYLSIENKKMAIELINNIARSSADNLHLLGFSIGLDDVYCNVEKDKENILNDIIYEIINIYRTDEREEIKNALMMKTLGRLREDLSSLLINKYLSKNNTAVKMFRAGSKGSLLNIIQMAGSLGQQIVNGKRIGGALISEKVFPVMRRGEVEILRDFIANPEMFKYEFIENLKSRGLITESFFSGLDVIAFFCHAISGREGLVDTAVKTAETGYMQRRLIKTLEDAIYLYDGTVRFGFDGKIILFDYFNYNCQEKMEFSNSLFFKILFYFIPKEIVENFKNCINKKEKIKNKILTYLYNLILSQRTNKIVSYENDGLSNILLELKNYFKISGDINIEFFYRNSLLIKNTLISMMKKIIPTKIPDYLSPVGSLAAQSIGEPGTQMTLKTFHFAGAMSMNITLGVPRLKEIINGTEIIKTSIINIEIEKYEEGAPFNIINQIKGYLSTKLFKDIIKNIIFSYKKTEISIEIFLNYKVEILKYYLPNFLKLIEIKFSKYFKIPINKITEKSILIFLTGNINFNITALLNKIKTEIGNIQIFKTGLKGIFIEKKGEEKYKLIAEGMGLHKILQIEKICKKTTVTNNIVEIKNILGVEAARYAIKNEIINVLKNHGIAIHETHINILADAMTISGSVAGATRHGILKIRDREKITSPLMMASFEQTADNLFSAALNGTVDKLYGMSEQIISGKVIKIGTGLTELTTL